MDNADKNNVVKIGGGEISLNLDNLPNGYEIEFGSIGGANGTSYYTFHILTQENREELKNNGVTSLSDSIQEKATTQKDEILSITKDGKSASYDIDSLIAGAKETDGLGKFPINELNVTNAILKGIESSGRLISQEEAQKAVIEKAQEQKAEYDKYLEERNPERDKPSKPSDGLQGLMEKHQKERDDLADRQKEEMDRFIEISPSTGRRDDAPSIGDRAKALAPLIDSGNRAAGIGE